MNRILIPILLIALLVILGCRHKGPDNNSESQRILPPQVDVPAAPTENPALLQDLDALQASVGAAPEKLNLRFDYLTALDRAGKYPEALEQARQLGAMKGENPFKSAAYLNFANIVLDKIPADDPQRPALIKEAVDYIKQAIDAEPGSVPSHLAYGRLALEIGDKDTAVHELSIALTASEIGYQLRMQLAQIFLEKGDKEKARVHLEAARRLAETAKDKAAMKKIDGMMSKSR